MTPPTKHLAWRIYYDDGTTFDAGQGSRHEAPGYGVVCVVQPCPLKGRVIVAGWNFYYYCAEDSARWPWWGSNQIGMVDQFARLSEHRSALKVGAHSAFYHDILATARDDEDFGLANTSDPLKPYPRGSLLSPDATWGD